MTMLLIRIIHRQNHQYMTQEPPSEQLVRIVYIMVRTKEAIAIAPITEDTAHLRLRTWVIPAGPNLKASVFTGYLP